MAINQVQNPFVNSGNGAVQQAAAFNDAVNTFVKANDTQTAALVGLQQQQAAAALKQMTAQHLNEQVGNINTLKQSSAFENTYQRDEAVRNAVSNLSAHASIIGASPEQIKGISDLAPELPKGEDAAESMMALRGDAPGLASLYANKQKTRLSEQEIINQNEAVKNKLQMEREKTMAQTVTQPFEAKIKGAELNQKEGEANKDRAARTSTALAGFQNELDKAQQGQANQNYKDNADTQKTLNSSNDMIGQMNGYIDTLKNKTRFDSDAQAAQEFLQKQYAQYVMSTGNVKGTEVRTQAEFQAMLQGVVSNWDRPATRNALLGQLGTIISTSKSRNDAILNAINQDASKPYLQIMQQNKKASPGGPSASLMEPTGAVFSGN